jgi:iron uptake system component EfeO
LNGTSPPTFRRVRTGRRAAAIGCSLGIVALAGIGCAKEDPAADAKGGAVKIVLTDAGCKPSPTKVGAGTTSFVVTNDGANGVSEAELKAGDGQSILGERENISPGLSGTFTIRLAEGTYKVYCPGAKQDTWTFTVKGGETVADWHDNPALVEAIEGYATYVNDQAADLVTTVKTLGAAVDAGDVDAAKQAYIAARLPYERIEPVAESFGDLDPRIDGRLGDNGNAPGDFIGFHRIEQALWVDGDLAGMQPIAAGLVDDVTKLQARIASKAKTYEPNEVTNGALELMTEVLTSKITGEEERYSHIDLVDFQANFDGSMKIVDLLRPVLEASAPDLLTKIDKAAERVQAELGELEATPGYAGSGFIEWSCAPDDSGALPDGCAVTKTAAVTTAQRRALTDAVKPLTTLLSEVPVKVVR